MIEGGRCRWGGIGEWVEGMVKWGIVRITICMGGMVVCGLVGAEGLVYSQDLIVRRSICLGGLLG